MASEKDVEIIWYRRILKIACLEEVAWRKGWITEKQLLSKARELNKNGYEEYLKALIS